MPERLGGPGVKRAEEEPTATGEGLALLVMRLARRLRGAGLRLGTGDVLVGIEAVAAVGLTDGTSWAHALRASWCRSREDLLRFETVLAIAAGGAEAHAIPKPIAPGPRALHLGAADAAAPGAGGRRRPGHRLVPSEHEGLATVDFGACTPAELAELAAAIAELRIGLPTRRSRRRRPARRGPQIDWARTRRAALRAGGEWLRVYHRRPRRRLRPVLLLCDVSGSMERYARVLLRFGHAAARGGAPIEAFVFSTTLTRVSRPLRLRDPTQALAAVGRQSAGWSGGTRIGDAVHELCTRWGPRALSRRPLTVVVSDGWETGSPERLGRELARLRRSSWRLIWGNPLMGDPGYAPTARGMAAALPHIDLLHPVHNLRSLEQLAAVLTATDPGAAPGARRIPGRPRSG